MTNYIRAFSLILVLGLVFARPASSQDVSTAKDVLTTNIASTGGADAWNAISDMHSVSENVIEFPQGVLVTRAEVWSIGSDYMVNKTKTLESPAGFPEGAGNATIFLTPDGGWIDSFQGKQDIGSLPGGMGDQIRSGMKVKDELDLLARPDSAFTLTEDELDGAASWVVEVAGEVPTRRFYDKGSFILIGVELTVPGIGKVMRTITDYRKVGDVMVSFGSEADMGPTGVQTSTVKTMEFNTDLTPESLAALVEG
jgi:hypothetical protein